MILLWGSLVYNLLKKLIWFIYIGVHIRVNEEYIVSKNIQAVRGMHDILPEETPYWSFLEKICRDLVSCYGYRYIRFPIVESSDLFRRSIGETTDIVEKEMYTFTDRNGDSLSLRPEGTIGCVRAGIQHGLLYNQIQRLWYMGAMFRRERPQKGRYRQFYQFGVEAYGMNEPEIDAEILLMSWRLWKKMGLNRYVELKLNNLGDYKSRMRYRECLLNFFKKNQDILDEESKRRLTSNPLRILDSKNPSMRSLIQQAPKLLDYLDIGSKRNFEKLKNLLSKAGLPYMISPTLVRGLDYYNSTVFEWVTDKLGMQGTICGGGRYDTLVEQIGGKSTPAVGFASGLERLVLLLQAKHTIQDPPDIYTILVGETARTKGLLWMETLRNECVNLNIEINLTNRSLKQQFRKAAKSGARWALVIAEEEMKKNKITIRNLFRKEPQETFSLQNLINFFRASIQDAE